MNCPIPTYEDNYISETASRIHKRIKDQNGRDHMSHMLKHSTEEHHDNKAQKTLNSLLPTLKLTNGIKKHQNHSG